MTPRERIVHRLKVALQPTMERLFAAKPAAAWNDDDYLFAFAFQMLELQEMTYETSHWYVSQFNDALAGLPIRPFNTDGLIDLEVWAEQLELAARDGKGAA